MNNSDLRKTKIDYFPEEIQERILSWNNNNLSLRDIQHRLEKNYGRKYSVSIATISKFLKLKDIQRDLAIYPTDKETKLLISEQPKKIFEEIDKIQEESLKRYKELEELLPLNNSVNSRVKIEKQMNEWLSTYLSALEKRIKASELFRIKEQNADKESNITEQELQKIVIKSLNRDSKIKPI